MGEVSADRSERPAQHNNDEPRLRKTEGGRAQRNALLWAAGRAAGTK